VKSDPPSHGLVASFAPLMSPCGLPLAGLMLGTEASTPAGHRLLLCLSPTAWQFPVPRAAIRAGGRRDKVSDKCRGARARWNMLRIPQAEEAGGWNSREEAQEGQPR